MNGVPDRVPLCTQLHEFAMREIGATAGEFYTNPEMLTCGTLEIQAKYGIDVPALHGQRCHSVAAHCKP